MNNPTAFDTTGDEPVEARIVAWVLGEASAFEAAELERLCEERPELLAFRRRMLVLHGLLTEAESAETDPAWKLAPAKRRQLDKVFGDEKSAASEIQKDLRIRRAGWRAFAGIAACLVLALLVLQLVRPFWHHEISVEPEITVDFMPAAAGGGGQDELNKAIRVQEDKVEERRKELAAIVRSRGITYKGQDSFYGQSGVDEDQSTRAALQTHIQLEQEKSQLESQINSLLKYDSDQLMVYASGLDLPDNIVKQIYPKYLEAKRQLESKKVAGLGDDHPDVKAGAEEVQRARKQIDEGVTNLRATLVAQRDMAAERLKNVEVTKNDRREDAIKRGLDAQDYVDAKRNFETDQALLQQMKLKQIERSIALNASAPPAPAMEETSRFAAGESASSLRSGDQAIRRSSIDAILNHPRRVAGEQGAFAESVAGGEDFSGASGSSSSNALSKDIVSNLALMPEHARQIDKVRSGLYTAEGKLNLGKYAEAKKEYEEVLRTDPHNSDARRGIEKVAAATSDYYRAAYDHTRAELLAEIDSAWELAVPASPAEPADAAVAYRMRLARAPERQEEVPLDLQALARSDELAAAEVMLAGEMADLIPAEELESLVAMEEIAAAENPFSTFSLNISDASFQLAQAAIAKGERPDPAAIKVEQFYNAVDYGDPAPASDEFVAAKIEQSAHPVIPGRNLIRVALRTGSAGRAASQPLRLTLLVDQSGSMVREDRRAAMEYALDQLGLLLTPEDRVSVIGFSRKSRLLADSLTGDQAGKLAELVHQSASEGGTNLEDAMQLGEQMAARHQLAGAQNRIVLFTDGAVNLGDAEPARLAEQVASLRQKGIAFDIAGIGTDHLNDRLLSEMARNGNGRYYVIGEERDGNFARQLAGAFRPAAENVKVQVKFNPERVGKYQLLGFEKDRLRTEDFRDDAVDAAELAAEEAGVAIYQIEPLAEGSGEIGEVSVRFRDVASGEMHERSWTIPHDPAAAAFGRATPSMQLAGLSLLAAEKLRGGPLADAIDFKQLSGPRAAVRQHYGNSPRVGDMLRVIDALE